MNFSVLISLYNKENPSSLKQALDSIFNQTVMPNEVVLVKDGPLTPELDEVINNYATHHQELKIIKLEKNMGLGYALNIGIEQCSNDWIARMDADDICFPDRFEKQIAIINKKVNISFIGSTIAEFYDEPSNIISYRNLPEKQGDIFNYAKRRCPLNHPTVMYRKKAVIDSGGYKEFPEDYHLWVRALMKGYEFYNIQEPLLYFRSNINTIRKRGGWKYLKLDIKHQLDFYKIGFLTLPQFISNISIRTFFRIIPANIRKRAYQKLLRKKTLQK